MRKLFWHKCEGCPTIIVDEPKDIHNDGTLYAKSLCNQCLKNIPYGNHFVKKVPEQDLEFHTKLQEWLKADIEKGYVGQIWDDNQQEFCYYLTEKGVDFVEKEFLPSIKEEKHE
jgi:hypothetical protein